MQNERHLQFAQRTSVTKMPNYEVQNAPTGNSNLVFYCIYFSVPVLNIRAWLHYSLGRDLLLLRANHAESETHRKQGETVRVKRYHK